MAQYVIAPVGSTASGTISISINDTYLVESSGNVSFANATISGVSDHELVWCGVLLTSLDSNITSEQPQPRFVSSLEAFDIASTNGSNWGGTSISPTHPESPHTQSSSSQYATVEVNYDGFSGATGSDYYAKCESVWKGGKYEGFPSATAYGEYAHSFTLDKTQIDLYQYAGTW
jgi:hypothetical protein